MTKIHPYHQPQPGATDPSQCNGCGVCMLSCPVWQQHHTKALTYCGRNRALIGGANEEDLAPAARGCILCGSCEALCPMGICTQQTTIALRRRLVEKGLMPVPVSLSKKKGTVTFKSSRVLLIGRAHGSKPALVSSLVELLGKGFEVLPEYGSDIELDLESGREISEARMKEVVAPLLAATEIVVSDGLLFNLLRSLLPSSILVRPLGQALLANPNVRSGLKAGDFYMIETRAYNARRLEFVALYDALRRETGCFMNLDLQRVATPTGAASYHHHAGLENIVSVEAQVKWLLEGRDARRIVVEHLDDQEAFAKYTMIPVVHLAEVVKG